MSVLGKQTVAELKDLLAAKDYTVGQLDRAYADFAPSWVNRDPQGFTDWTSDWNALHRRYESARASAQRAIDLAKVNVLGDSLIVADVEYHGMLTALKQVDGTITKGDLQELVNRITAAGKAPDLSQTPQPTAQDADLGAYKAADAAVKVVEGAGESLKKSAASLLTPKAVVVGLLCVGVIVGVATAARRALP